MQKVNFENLETIECWRSFQILLQYPAECGGDLATNYATDFDSAVYGDAPESPISHPYQQPLLLPNVQKESTKS